MINKLYITVQEAVEKLGHSFEDIIYLSSNKKLPLYVRSVGWKLQQLDVDVSDGMCFAFPIGNEFRFDGLLLVSNSDIVKLESGNEFVIISSFDGCQHIFDKKWKPKEKGISLPDELLEDISGEGILKIIGEQVVIKKENLLILIKDIKRPYFIVEDEVSIERTISKHDDLIFKSLPKNPRENIATIIDVYRNLYKQKGIKPTPNDIWIVLPNNYPFSLNKDNQENLIWHTKRGDKQYQSKRALGDWLSKYTK